MINDYRRTKTTVSLINYHFVFCPRYRRKIFLNTEVEKRFKELVQEICGELDISIVAMKCDKDHVHLFLNTLPTLSPANIMNQGAFICTVRVVQDNTVQPVQQIISNFVSKAEFIKATVQAEEKN